MHGAVTCTQAWPSDPRRMSHTTRPRTPPRADPSIAADPLWHFIARLPQPQPHLPPPHLLRLLGLLAAVLRVRQSEVLTHLLALLLHKLEDAPEATLASSATGPARFAALQAVMSPLAAAAARRALTRAEFAAFTGATAPLLAEAARTFESFHWVVDIHGGNADPQTIPQLMQLVGLALRYDASAAKVADLVMPHFRAAARQRMLTRTPLQSACGVDQAVVAAIAALHVAMKDLRYEHSLARFLPEGYMAASAAVRYRMVTRALEAALFGTTRVMRDDDDSHGSAAGASDHADSSASTEDERSSHAAAELSPSKHLQAQQLREQLDGLLHTHTGSSGLHCLLYDQRTQQLEDALRAMHKLLAQLGLSEAQHDTGSASTSPSQDRLALLPCKALAYLIYLLHNLSCQGVPATSIFC